jgi:dephospho-CoA kinase
MFERKEVRQSEHSNQSVASHGLKTHVTGRMSLWPVMYSGKPIIGIAGGIGSGKSFVANLFAQLGCAVLDADAQVRQAYADPQVLQVLRQWWGDGIFRPDGAVHRSAIARKVFGDPKERERLEALLHPMVARFRDGEMKNLASNPKTVAFVWDTPLLFEAGLNSQCDAVVFIDTPLHLRLRRVSQARGWDEAELLKREKLQWPLDTKREISDYFIENTADADVVRDQVRDVLSRILARASQPEPT